MSEPFLSEIKIVSFNFPPKGWALCNGQFLPINQNQALFALLGTTYGGNGQTTFALPNIRGRVPIHMGNGHTLGEAAGSTAVTITQQTMAQHLHFAQASTSQADQATLLNPNGNTPNILAAVTGAQYTAVQSLTTIEPTSVTTIGGSQAHTNMMPYLVLNFIIALQGIFPSQN
jgi:microcystin-dependent protein